MTLGTAIVRFFTPLPPSVQFLRYFDFIVCGGELDSPGGGQGRDLEAACRISDGRRDPVKWWESFMDLLLISIYLWKNKYSLWSKWALSSCICKTWIFLLKENRLGRFYDIPKGWRSPNGENNDKFTFYSGALYVTVSKFFFLWWPWASTHFLWRWETLPVGECSFLWWSFDDPVWYQSLREIRKRCFSPFYSIKR